MGRARSSASTPRRRSFPGANEREIGLLLKLAGLTWARDALDAARRRRSTITDDDVRTLLADIVPERARRNGRAVSQDGNAQRPRRARHVAAETKDVFHRVRDFLAAAAQRAGRARDDRSSTTRWRSTRAGDDETLSDVADAPSTSTARQAAREAPRDGRRPTRARGPRAAGAGRRCSARSRRPTSTPRRSSCMRLAGITPGGKVRLRDGRTR